MRGKLTGMLVLGLLAVTAGVLTYRGWAATKNENTDKEGDFELHLEAIPGDPVICDETEVTFIATLTCKDGQSAGAQVKIELSLSEPSDPPEPLDATVDNTANPGAGQATMKAVFHKGGEYIATAEATVDGYNLSASVPVTKRTSGCSATSTVGASRSSRNVRPTRRRSPS